MKMNCWRVAGLYFVLPGAAFCLTQFCSAGFCSAQARPLQDPAAAIVDALRAHQFSQAEILSQAALAKRPDDYRVWALRGMADAGLNQSQQALVAYRRALRISPAYLPALEGAAQSAFQLGLPEAESLLGKILAQRPDDETAHAMLGVLAYRAKDCPAAIAHFEKAPRAINGQPAALSEFGFCLSQSKQYEEAIPRFAAALALNPAKSEARYNLALAQWNARHGEDALNTLKESLDRLPVDGDAMKLAAEISEAKGDTAQAVALLHQALTANPKDLEAYLTFASLSFDHASPQVGIDMLNFGLTQMPKEPRLLLVRGILLTQVGEFTRAAEDFATASRIDPQLQFLGVAEGLVQSQQHQSAEAIARFRAAVKAHPHEAYALYLLAEALQEEGHPESSAEYNEELDAASRAVSLDPQLVAAKDLLAALYLENGHTEKAISISRAALALDPNDQQAVYHLILALRKSDAKDELPELLKRLVELRAREKAQPSTGRRYRLVEAAASTDLGSH
jgi:tetratricopeptide (TPR) repeat protein